MTARTGGAARRPAAASRGAGARPAGRPPRPPWLPARPRACGGRGCLREGRCAGVRARPAGAPGAAARSSRQGPRRARWGRSGGAGGLRAHPMAAPPIRPSIATSATLSEVASLEWRVRSSSMNEGAASRRSAACGARPAAGAQAGAHASMCRGARAHASGCVRRPHRAARRRHRLLLGARHAASSAPHPSQAQPLNPAAPWQRPRSARCRRTAQRTRAARCRTPAWRARGSRRGRRPTATDPSPR